MEETGQVAPTGCPGGLDLTVGLGPVVRRLDRPEDPDRGRLGRTGRQTAEQERQPGVVATLVVAATGSDYTAFQSARLARGFR